MRLDLAPRVLRLEDVLSIWFRMMESPTTKSGLTGEMVSATKADRSGPTVDPK